MVLNEKSFVEITVRENYLYFLNKVYITITKAFVHD